MAAIALEPLNETETLPRKTAPTAKLQKSVLLIEDSEEAMWLVRYAIDEYGDGRYRLAWASTLCTGLDRLTKGDIDVVLLDLGLPESSGAESYSWVRQVAPETPVVILTGDGREETEFAVTASGVEGYLTKDQVSGSLLLQAIRSALYEVERKQHPRDMLNKLFQMRFRSDD